MKRMALILVLAASPGFADEPGEGAFKTVRSALNQLLGAARADEPPAVAAAGKERQVVAPAGEKEIGEFIDRAARRIKSSESPREAAEAARKEAEALLLRAGSPGAVMTLIIFRDKNIGDRVKAREAELYEKNTPREVRAEQAAAKLRELIAEERTSERGRGILALIREVSVEKDFLGRPRLKLLVPRLDPVRRCRSCSSEDEKFEDAVAWNFSDYPLPHPMSGFGVGYRIDYNDALPRE